MGYVTNKVDVDKIEDIVGVPRHWRAHWARAVSKEQMVYILHSKICLEDNADLRNCEYSLALDRGINVNDWILDKPVVVQIINKRLTPALIGT